MRASKAMIKTTSPVNASLPRRTGLHSDGGCLRPKALQSRNNARAVKPLGKEFKPRGRGFA